MHTNHIENRNIKYVGSTI